MDHGRLRTTSWMPPRIAPRRRLRSAPGGPPDLDLLLGNADPGPSIVARPARPAPLLGQDSRTLARQAQHLGHLVITQPTYIHGEPHLRELLLEASGEASRAPRCGRRG